MSAEVFVTVAGLVISNVIAFLALARSFFRDRDKALLAQGVVPLEYFEQIQKGQSDYIKVLETRIDSSLTLWKQCEADKERLHKEIEVLEQRISDLEHPNDHR